MNKKPVLLIAGIIVFFLNSSADIYGGSNDLEAVLKNSDGTSAFEVQDSTAKALVRMQSDGKVGVGVTVPEAFLHVKGTSSTALKIEGNAIVMDGNLGIGTASPANALEIAGAAVITGSVTASAFIGDGSGITGISSDAFAVISSNITDGTIAGADLSSSLDLTTTGTISANRLAVTGDGFVVDSTGSVTAALITTTGSITANKLIITGNDFAIDNAGSMTALAIKSRGSITAAGTVTASAFSFASGQVGGTISASTGTITVLSSWMDVRGTLTAMSFIGDGSGITGISSSAIAVVSSSITDGTIQSVDLAPNISINTMGTISATRIANGSDTFVVDSSGSMTVSTLKSTGSVTVTGTVTVSNDLVVDTSTLFVDSTNNRVGIGTITPALKLHIVGSSTISGRVGIGTTTPNAALDIVGSPAIALTTLNVSGTTTITGGYSGIGTTTPAMRLHIVGSSTISGNVGIGTTTPSSPLHVSGAATISGNTGIGTTTPALKLHIVGSSTISGNIGIGTTTPSSPLHVAGAATISGNTGIGTTTPSLKLHVVGSSTISGRVGIGTTTPSAVLDIIGSSTIALTTLNVSGTTTMTGGNVSIGTTTTSVDLHVEGTVTVSNSLNIGTTTAGAAITMHLSESSLITFGSISNNSCADKFFSVAGASDGDTVFLGVPAAMVGTGSPTSVGLAFFGYVIETNSVAVRACNFTGSAVTPTAGTVTADVWKH